MYFSLFCAWLSFFLRPVVASILWFISLDYVHIMKHVEGHSKVSILGAAVPEKDSDEALFQQALRGEF
jgi:hypothetical protein